MNVIELPTTPYPDSKAGTSGLRKTVPIFSQERFVENWLQGLFNSQPAPSDHPGLLVTGGDGRFFSDVAVQRVIKMAFANGFKHIIVGQNGILSTPCVSTLIRKRKADGGIILTASHNPGGPNADFGMKYNISTGAPAPEDVMEAQYVASQKLTTYKSLDHPDFDIQTIGTTNPFPGVTLEVIDSCEAYIAYMKEIFDFDLLKSLFNRKEFSFVFDALNGVTGPYAKQLFVKEFGCPESSLLQCTPLPDFGGLHPDPNQTYAKTLVDKMFIGKKGDGTAPVFGAACDGDGDRNMILGAHCFVNPADSLAIIVENAEECIPYFKGKDGKSGITGVSRSCPTAGCLDLVAAAKGLKCFEVPTGWKFFGNLMDAGLINICGEESFGTGSDHIREKDGLWAVLCWLSIIANESKKAYPGGDKVVSVKDIVMSYWKRHGRFFIQRYDYDGIEKAAANSVYDGIVQRLAGKTKEELLAVVGNDSIASCDVFNYEDPVTKAKSPNQGIRIYFTDGSRVVMRISGTSSSGATIRLYFEKYLKIADGDSVDKYDEDPALVLAPLVESIKKISKMQELTGRDAPSVIT
ncbi:Phosphoglucomutase [Blattamonas nauphoetae]|uniref:phosphoglucomutase (alpha-D-glucose-1,6-bisphosphate-dependent) n=1 Tax=Blattamonas nauphoetae TaxID=2049346 RepID=A0ABQ9YM34_9EUKA|nr:Phosphoglucomutase [Blattamonas nauphoetae]